MNSKFRRASWLALSAVGVIGLATGCGVGQGDGQTESPAVEDPKPRPLVVLGIDGMTWDLAQPMMDRGEMPHLAELVKRGLRGDMIAIPPLSSPTLWTTFATGRFARHHNVMDHTYPYVAGPKRRVRSTLRRVPAIWNIASHYERSVGVVGYFASHPAEIVNGVMVSDRAWGSAEGVYPPELLDELRPDIDQLQQREEIQKLQQRYLHWPYDIHAIHRPEDRYHRVTRVVKGRIGKHVVTEELVRRAALRLAPRDFDLFMVYLRMPDHASHATWMYFDDAEFEDKPSPLEKELLSDIIPTSYRDTDDFLGRLVAELGDEVNLVVISDHGFGPAAGSWKPGNKDDELFLLSGSHRPDGIFLAAGPDIVAGELPSGVNAMDIAPTLLALLGLPISEELPGGVVEDVLDPRIRQQHEPRSTPSYRMRWKSVDTEEELREDVESEDLEMLASLGYVSSEASVADASAAEDLDFWEIDERLRRNLVLGEGLFHLLRDDREAIAELLGELQTHDPLLAEHLPRVLRKRLGLWQESFPFPLVSEQVRQWVDSGFVDEPADD